MTTKAGTMPKSLSQMLHDEIDFDEGMISEAFGAVDEVKSAMADAVEQTGDIEAAMILIVQLLDSKLADTTTKSFKSHVDFARGRADAG